jgi:hypothetical protein
LNDKTIKKQKKMNPTVSKALNYATIGGAAILVVGAAKQLISQPFTAKGSVMPLVSILVGVAAFNYAIKGGSPIVVEKKA